MNSRMERYNNKEIQEEAKSISRVSKNTLLYQDIKTNELSRVRNNDNVKVIDNNGKTIDIDKIRKYINEINDQPRAGRRKSVSVNEDNLKKEEVKEDNTPKDYDINSVLEKAKQTREIDYERERYKKLRDTQYDILNKIKVYDEQDEKDNYEDEFNTDERTLIDLINTVTIHKGDVNLLEELVGNGDEETTLPIKDEIERGTIKEDILKEVQSKPQVEVSEDKDTNLDKTQGLVKLKEKSEEVDNSFFTSSTSFSKEDFDGFEELEKSVKKSGVITTIMIVVLVVFIIATLVFMANYVFELGLF